MVQKTLVLKINGARATDLKRRLGDENFEFRPVPYALFSAKGEGVVTTYYTSGKLVVQGAEPELFIERYLGGELLQSSSARGDESRGPGPGEPGANAPGAKSGMSGDTEFDDFEREALIGSDECGKGDYFGPLVVAAVRLEAGDAQKLRGGEVRDSKGLSDEACLRLGAALRGKFPHAIARLDPPRYNQIYQRKGQLNEILADLHTAAISKLARPGIRVLVDKFANASLLDTRLAGLGIRLEQRVRAEAYTAVAAASIIAREQFLTALKQLSDDEGVDLHKGAGSPVDKSANRFVQIHGMEGLARVAKLHFKNTQKIRAQRR
jgi:ribonuclease HIII